MDDEGQTFLDEEESDEEADAVDSANDVVEPEPVEPKGGPTQREQDAERALRAAYFGILLQPLQLYAAWLLLGVWFSKERLGADYRRQAWKALAISGPFLLLWLLVLKIMFFSGYYYTDYDYWDYYDLE